MPKTLYLIDDLPEEAAEYADLIGRETDSFTISVLKPTEDRELIGSLAGDTDTAGFLIDQVLDNEVSYSGTDLAAYIRGVREDVPVFMLTKRPDEVEHDESSGAVDNVFPKELVRHRAGALVKRIERRLGLYWEALGGKLQRLQELLNSSMEAELTPEQAEELLSLQHYIERPMELVTREGIKRDRAILDSEQSLLEQLKGVTAELKHLRGEA